MNNILHKTLQDKKCVIGALHFPPMPGYSDYPGFDICLKNAIEDLIAFQSGGVTAVILENNYDVPHKTEIDTEVYEEMKRLIKELKKVATVPLGVSVLWNDYRSALNLAKELSLDFIRIPVFVDHVRSRYGEIVGDAAAVMNYRTEIQAENVALFTDIHVKHAEILSNTTIAESAQLAIASGSDCLIVTGKWTGDVPAQNDLAQVRMAVNDFPIVAGSGCDASNIHEVLKFANGAIVSTALKTGEIDSVHSDNLKGWDQRISQEKVKNFMNKVYGRV